ncbi:hypothetical protein Krac_4612 [Ktedonobacter racemifer DSM 44963]|uniref:Uncharacterized protein n=1 Tax=Ktedonobacter racemifer DSM 44963 TaxID=485913 RepID=D6TT69_KTERA|nr:hypothetical protein Krac_4612 [Ktedonobacter racemifer DSM 44963]
MLGIQTRSLQCHSDAVERGSPAVSRLRKSQETGEIGTIILVKQDASTGIIVGKRPVSWLLSNFWEMDN